ncbi:MAG: hypothetical protein LBQ69_05085 [Treponema sp.]|jgi:hypothetical protein|nr:hypothetical protein [Treponema sp.]
MTAPIVISIISLCLCISGFFFFRWYVAKKTAASSLLADYRAEVYRLIAEIDAATDRDSLLVEERIKTLKQVLDDTDRRISVYMRELQRSRSGEAMYASLGRGIRAALDSRPPAATEQEPPASLAVAEPPAAGESQGGARAPATRKRGARKRKAVPEGGNALFAQTPPAKPKIKVQIAELSAQGLSPPEIASRLELSIAEVDLALNLLHRG